MTKKSTNITEAEWPIMSLLWKRGTATSAEIVEEILRGRDISMRTVKALINRLVEKKRIAYVRDEKDSRLYHYFPAVTEEEAVADRRHSLLSVFDGSPGRLLAHFMKDAKLTRAEIDELRALLDDKEGEADAR